MSRRGTFTPYADEHFSHGAGLPMERGTADAASTMFAAPVSITRRWHQKDPA